MLGTAEDHGELPRTGMPAPPAVRGDLGERVAARRRAQGLSRRVVANLVGRSEEWLRQVERGQRRLDSIEVLVHLGRVLHIADLGEFLGWQARGPQRAPAHGPLTERLRAALVLPLWPGSPAGPSAPLARLVEQVDRAGQLWRTSPHRRGGLAPALPGLVTGLRDSWLAGAPEAEVLPPLGRAYGLARTLADRLGEHHLSWLAAEQYLAVAGRTGDPVVRAAAIGHRVAAMRRMRYAPEAYDLALSHAETLTAPEHRVLRGALLLQAAEAAAERNLRGEVSRLVARARELAGAGDGEQVRELVGFGPCEVDVREVGMAVRLGELDTALRLSRNVRVAEDLPIDRRTGYLVTMAYLYARLREDVASVFALNRVASSSPEDLRFHPYAQAALRGLVRRGHVLVAEDIARLSRLAGAA